MIKLLEQNFLPSVVFADGFSMTKIAAGLLAYGNNYPFFTVWQQLSDEGQVTALLCKTEQTAIIAAKNNADVNELTNFLKIVGFESLQGEAELLKKLGADNLKYYTVVCKTGDSKKALPPMPNLSQVYDILYYEENPHIKRTNYEGFYVDLSHRIRHGCGAAVVCDQRSTAIASHVTDDSAVISGVAVLPDNRGKGLGSKALIALLNGLGERKIFAAAENQVLPFYIKNGFEIYETIAIYEPRNL